MKLIIINDNGSHHKKINLNWRTAITLLLVFSVVLVTIFITSPYLKTNSISKSEIQLLNKFDSMFMKTVNLEAQIMRLNTLGKIIAAKSNINIEAYLLTEVPAMGGIDNGVFNDDSFSSSIITKNSLADSIDDLELELQLTQQRYNIMRTAQLSSVSVDKNQLKKTVSRVMDYSMPVSTGYISSAFGKRRDPINGHQRHHNGIDIAAKKGSEIHAIASGFVTFAGRKGGYGNVVDIRHSKSLKSRYAHLDTIKVKKGQVVRKSDTIATMGQTGRATGSHLHLEVWKKNRPVNPESFIDLTLIK